MPSVPVERFGGLNLIADPQELGMQQAASLLNVSLDRNGRVRTRDGYAALYTSTVAQIPTALYPVSNKKALVAIGTDSVKAVDLGLGTSLASVALTAGSSSFAAAGSSAVYFTDTTTTQIRKYSGGAFSSPAGLAAYEGVYLAVQPLDDRLVIADANSTSKLWFSDVATPETITASNNLQVTPGDGQPITGMAVFGTELFVFKQTKFFRFYGNSTNSIGAAEFNYQMVDTGVGCSAQNGYTLTATHQTGVYFVGTDGVYRTTGGPPEKVSGPIDPVFAGMNLPVPSPFSSVMADPLTVVYNLAVASDKLHMFAAAGALRTTPLQFVMDIRTGEWTVYNLNNAGAMLDGDLVGYEGSIIVAAQNGSGNAFIARMSDAASDDAGTAISWHHESGFYDLGYPASEKQLRKVTLWGSGTVTVQMAANMGSNDTGSSVTLGTAPAVAEGSQRFGRRGVLFSHRFSGSGAATVHRMVHDVRTVRPEGLRSS